MDDRKHRHIVSLGKCISNSPPNQCLSALHFNYYQAFEDILNVLRNRVIDLEFELAYLWSNVDILSQEYVTMWDKMVHVERLLQQQQNIISQLLSIIQRNNEIESLAILQNSNPSLFPFVDPSMTSHELTQDDLVEDDDFDSRINKETFFSIDDDYSAPLYTNWSNSFEPFVKSGQSYDHLANFNSTAPVNSFDCLEETSPSKPPSPTPPPPLCSPLEKLEARTKKLKKRNKLTRRWPESDEVSRHVVSKAIQNVSNSEDSSKQSKKMSFTDSCHYLSYRDSLSFESKKVSKYAVNQFAKEDDCVSQLKATSSHSLSDCSKSILNANIERRTFSSQKSLDHSSETSIYMNKPFFEYQSFHKMSEKESSKADSSHLSSSHEVNNQKSESEFKLNRIDCFHTITDKESSKAESGQFRSNHEANSQKSESERNLNKTEKENEKDHQSYLNLKSNDDKDLKSLKDATEKLDDQIKVSPTSSSSSSSSSLSSPTIHSYNNKLTTQSSKTLSNLSSSLPNPVTAFNFPSYLNSAYSSLPNEDVQPNSLTDVLRKEQNGQVEQKMNNVLNETETNTSSQKLSLTNKQVINKLCGQSVSNAITKNELDCSKSHNGDDFKAVNNKAENEDDQNRDEDETIKDDKVTDDKLEIKNDTNFNQKLIYQSETRESNETSEDQINQTQEPSLVSKLSNDNSEKLLHRTPSGKRKLPALPLLSKAKKDNELTYLKQVNKEQSYQDLDQTSSAESSVIACEPSSEPKLASKDSEEKKGIFSSISENISWTVSKGYQSMFSVPSFLTRDFKNKLSKKYHSIDSPPSDPEKVLSRKSTFNEFLGGLGWRSRQSSTDQLNSSLQKHQLSLPELSSPQSSNLPNLQENTEINSTFLNCSQSTLTEQDFNEPIYSTQVETNFEPIINQESEESKTELEKCHLLRFHRVTCDDVSKSGKHKTSNYQKTIDRPISGEDDKKIKSEKRTEKGEEGEEGEGGKEKGELKHVIMNEEREKFLANRESEAVIEKGKETNTYTDQLKEDTDKNEAEKLVVEESNTPLLSGDSQQDCKVSHTSRSVKGLEVEESSCSNNRSQKSSNEEEKNELIFLVGSGFQNKFASIMKQKVEERKQVNKGLTDQFSDSSETTNRAEEKEKSSEFRRIQKNKWILAAVSCECCFPFVDQRSTSVF